MRALTKSLLVLAGATAFGACSTSPGDGNSTPAGDPQQAKIELGFKLMFDERLSVPQGVACGTCHDPNLGWGDARPQGKGVQDNTLDTNGHNPDVAIAGAQYKTVLTPRNTPTVYNSHLFPNLFWDGRAGDLQHQAQFPFEAGAEMNSSWVNHILPTIQADPDYAPLYTAAYGDSTVTRERSIEAMGTYEATISVFDTPFDDFLAGDSSALSESEQRGHDLFFGQAGCHTCHPAPLLTDFSFHNTGVPTVGTFALNNEVDLGFGVRTDITALPNGSEVQHDDPADYAKFKTPQLRMVDVTGPYMHNGAFLTLEEVVDFYNDGGGPDLSGTGTKSPLIVPLGLTQQQKDDLVAFLKTGLLGTEIK